MTPKPLSPIMFHGWRLLKVAPSVYEELNMRSYGGIADFTTSDAAELAADLPRLTAAASAKESFEARLSRSLDSAQIQALRAIYGTKAKGGRRVWVGDTWNGMYNGLAGHGLCRVRNMSGGGATRARYEARVTKLGRAVLEAWDK